MTTGIIISKACGFGSITAMAGGIYFAMTDAVAISAITSIAAVVMAGVSAYFAYKAKTISQETHAAVNSRLSEFMEMAKKSFRAEGVLEGKEAAEKQAGLVATAKAEGVAQEKALK